MRRFYRELSVLTFALAAILITLRLKLPLPGDWQRFDLMLGARSRLAEAGVLSYPHNKSQVVMVAVDLDSYKRFLRPYSVDLLRPLWAKVAGLAFASGATVVGIDLPFGDDLSNVHVTGVDYDLDGPLLDAAAAHRGKLVLGTRVPAFPKLAQALGPGAQGSPFVFGDADGVVRRVGKGDKYPTFYAALARAADPAVQLPEEILIAPYRHLETAIPTYSLIDVVNCGEDSKALGAIFKDKIVILGLTNIADPASDRVETSARFLSPATRDSPSTAPCGLKLLGASIPETTSVPSVFVHAFAVSEVLWGRITVTASPRLVALGTGVMVAIISVCAMYLGPLAGFVAAAVLIVAASGIGIIEFIRNYYVPLELPIYASTATPIAAFAVQYFVETRRLNRVRRAFSHYIAPEIVERLANDVRALTLGGELRDITVMFADLSGFTAMSGRLNPEALTAKVNRYLSYVVQHVEATGGYVDKFIGDAVMAIWGAPHGDSNHAVNAVRAAIRTVQAVEDARREDEARGEPGFSIKIGINSGRAVVGNVGTERRYNYTAVGETVNLASRLEGVPRIYECHIVLGAPTADLVKAEFLLRELDLILVKGGLVPISIFEPLCEQAAASPRELQIVTQFEKALRLLREMHFDEAAELWEALARYEANALTGDRSSTPKLPNPAVSMAQWARELASKPPSSPWNGVRVLLNK